MRLRYLLLLFLIFASGCTTIPLQKARADFFSGNPAEADKALENAAGYLKGIVFYAIWKRDNPSLYGGVWGQQGYTFKRHRSF
jgi:hypothetical protein